MGDRKEGWTSLQRQEGSDFLAWVDERQMLQRKFDTLAAALRMLLHRKVHTTEEALNVWRAVPAVMGRCNEQQSYGETGAPTAYAWLHLLDRYVRTWLALERLVKENCLPMGKYGIGVLDVGTGPGPSAFAIHDFYNATVEYSEIRGNPRWRQPAELTCVELDAGTNSLRHHLTETLFAELRQESGSGIAICSALPDFGKILPTQERRQTFQALRNEEGEYYDETRNEWTSQPCWLPDEANAVAQSLHRYRLFAFGNFLTTPDRVNYFERNLLDILVDARPGSAVLVLGGKGRPYPEVYRSLDRLTRPAGFQLKIEGELVSYSDKAEVGDQVYEEGQRFYRFLMQRIPRGGIDEDARQTMVRAHFEGARRAAPSSQIRAYRK